MDITKRLRGHRIDTIMSNGTVLQIRLSDGHEFNIAWVDDNGVPIRGRPLVSNNGFRMKAGAVEIVTGASQGLPPLIGMN